MAQPLNQLRIMLTDDRRGDIVIPIPQSGNSGFLSLGDDVPIDLPNGERIEVYAEVAPDKSVPDVSLSIVEDGRVFGVRCGFGVIITYTTRNGCDLLLQIGTGAWDE